MKAVPARLRHQVATAKFSTFAVLSSPVESNMNQISCPKVFSTSCPKFTLHPAGTTVIHNRLGYYQQDQQFKWFLIQLSIYIFGWIGALLFLGGVGLTWTSSTYLGFLTYDQSSVPFILACVGQLMVVLSMCFHMITMRIKRTLRPGENVDQVVISGSTTSTPAKTEALQTPPTYDQCIEKPQSYSSLKYAPLPVSCVILEPRNIEQVHTLEHFPNNQLTADSEYSKNLVTSSSRKE